MKMSPELEKAQINMKPGVITADGFLGSDKRLLVDIIEEDEKLVSATKKSVEEIVDRMNYFTEESKKGLGDLLVVDDIYEIRIDETRGHLPCPFKDGIFRKINTYVKNLKLNKSIYYSELTKHLISKHHFFQGVGSPYRMEPSELVSIIFS